MAARYSTGNIYLKGKQNKTKTVKHSADKDDWGPV
jgi:hypothetical protein